MSTDKKPTHITPQSVDFSQWYQDVIKIAELAESSEVRGCGIVKPYGYKIWDLIKTELAKRIKDAGVEDIYFPMFLPIENLETEKDHIEGFAPELAVVTHAGGEELARKLAVRPTSEASMYKTYAKWIQSYRDLPMKFNQWANVVRWEKRPRAFLRWSEFQWQEGHTAFPNEESARSEMWEMLEVYKQMYKWMATPVFDGKKSEMEKFSGAVMTTTVEAVAKDGKGIQAATSHYLGTNFAKAFDVTYLGEDGKQHYVHQNSWGLSWRSVGAIIMVHGDDRGLRLPPNIAPIQIVLIPITNNENKAEVLGFLDDLKSQLSEFRVKIDDREDRTVGFKFNEWEVKGVPIRLEVGKREIDNDRVTMFRRDTNKKNDIDTDNLKHTLASTLSEIQNNLFKQAQDFSSANIKRVEDMDEIDASGGFFEASWSETPESEKILKEKFGITSRVLLKNNIDKSPKNNRCFITGDTAKHDWLFAKSY